MVSKGMATRFILLYTYVVIVIYSPTFVKQTDEKN
jgi:hypothetical protein